MGDNHLDESDELVEESVTASEPVVTETAGDTLTYRLISTDEWPRLAPFLSFCSPGQPTPILDPLSQSVIVAESPSGEIIGAAIASGVFHVAYLLPLAKEVNILTMQREAEALLPPETLYYTMVHDSPEVDVMRDELGMQRIDGVAVLVKKKT